VLVGGLAVLSFLPTHALPMWLWLGLIYLTVFLDNAAGQFFNPSRFAILGQVVEADDDRARAAGMEYATSSVAAIVGPPLAAPLLFGIGLQWALSVNALSYVFSYFVIRSMSPAAKTPPAPPQEEAGAEPAVGSLRADFVAGLRVFATNRYLVAILVVTVICQLGTSALNSLDIFFVTDNLHASGDLYGFVMTAFGLGSVLGALLAGRVVGWIGARTTTAGGLLVAGVLLVLYAKQTNFVVALVVFTLVAVPIAALSAALGPLLLAAIPANFIGRVMGVVGPLGQLAAILSAVTWGWLASTVLLHFDQTIAGVHFGRMDTIFALSGVLILLGGVYGLLALPRETSSEPEAVPEESAAVSAAEFESPG
jgi:MFS family permease